jgi:hypothetical protein
MSARDAALNYIRRGWAPVPIPFREKGPRGKGWPSLRLTVDSVPSYFNGRDQNIGLIMGEPSAGLADVDLDCAEALALADSFLPRTDAIFGRESTPRAHRLYYALGLRARQFKLGAEMLVELRANASEAGKALQTMAPPSTHPSGEPVEWQDAGEPAEVQPERLAGCVAELAAACVFLRHWPEGKGRHPAIMALVAWLTRCGWSAGKVMRFVAPIATNGTGDRERARLIPEELRRLVDDAAERHAAGEQLQGFRTVAETFGEQPARLAAEWLGAREPSAGTASPAWPEPLDIIGDAALAGWPELTADCLPEPLFRYATAEAERLNVDPCPLAAHVLAACAASISDGWAIKPKRNDRWTQHPRLWTCVVKDVGARGTEMLRSAFWPVKERDKALFDEWKREHATWQARQKAKDKNDRPDDDPEPNCRRMVSQDATIEAASEILAHGDEHAKLTLLCDELVAFLGGFGRYSPNGSAQRALWLESYDGGPQRIDRIKRGHVFVPNWSMVIAGNIQPRRLAGMAKDLIDDGLFQRFMTIHTRPAELGLDDDRPLPADIGRDYRDLHRALGTLTPPTGADGEVTPAWVDEDGRGERQAFMRLVERLQVDPTLPTIIREVAPKWSGLLARLALVFHVVELAEQARQGASLEPAELCRVTGPTVTAAATFIRRVSLPNLFRLGFETMPEGDAPAGHARWLAGYILAHRSEAITAREIGRAHRPLRGKAWETEQAMAVLCDAGWAMPAEGRHDGARWTVNPAVHARFADAAEAERARRVKVMQALGRKVADL